MTPTQSDAIWEICRQGLPLLADEAAECWEKGQAFEFKQQIRVARTLEALIEQCNWEVCPQEETA